MTCLSGLPVILRKNCCSIKNITTKIVFIEDWRVQYLIQCRTTLIKILLA